MTIIRATQTLGHGRLFKEFEFEVRSQYKHSKTRLTPQVPVSSSRSQTGFSIPSGLSLTSFHSGLNGDSASDGSGKKWDCGQRQRNGMERLAVEEVR